MFKIFSYFKKKLPSILWLFGCPTAVLFFRQPINVVLSRVFVEPIISTFENNILNSVLLSIGAILLLLWLWVYGSKRFLVQLSIYTVLFYLIVINSGFWQFYTFRFLPFSKAWDLIVLALSLPILKVLFPERKRAPSHHASDGFVEDMPIENTAEDSFKRGELAKEIADRIALTINKRSFAIGILGEYGSGKTSFINLIKANLDRAKIEIIDFNPWTSDRTNSIQQDFFDLLASKLYEINPQISSLVLDYSRKLVRADSSFEKVTRQLGLAGNLFNRRNHSDDYASINQLLAVSGKKIVVTIDDLDRLYNEEVMEVLRLIRNTANFTNIIYLAAYERSYLDEAISSINNNVNSSFLDKIIQLEIPLPKRNSNDLLDLLEEHLNQLLKPEELESYKNHIIRTGFQSNYEFTFDKIFRQSRDVIKFLNNFKITYTKLGDEVLFENLFVLELIKFRFPLIYDRLYDQRDQFVHDKSMRSLHEQYFELTTYKEGDQSKPEITRTLKKESKYSDDDIELIGRLVTHLFFRFDSSKKAKNSIIYPMFFNRYFRYRLSGNEISERQFKAAMDRGLDGMKGLIDSHAERKLLKELEARLLQIKAVDRSQYELQVESLFYLGPKFIKVEGRRAFDYDALISLLWNYEGRVEKKYYRNDGGALTLFLERLFADAQFPFTFQHTLIYHLKDDSRIVALPKEQLTGYQVTYFNQHVQQGGLTDDAVFMFWWTASKEFVSLPNDTSRGHYHNYIEPKMVVAVNEAIKNNEPSCFLKFSIKYDMQDMDIYTIQKEVLEMYNEPEELRNMVATHPKLDKDVQEEYLSLFDACKANGFNKWTEFELHTLLKPNRTDQN